MATKNNVKPIPEGYYAVTPWVIVNGASDFLDYVKAAFGAEEIARMANPDGKIGHAEFRIGDSIVMTFDSRENWPPTPAFLRLYVDDSDAIYRQALEAGGTSVTEVTELAFGHRVGRVHDPFGNIWWIQSRVEEVSLEEMGRRAGEKVYADAMGYVESSLDQAMKNNR
jgi:PhnB protein